MGRVSFNFAFFLALARANSQSAKEGIDVLFVERGEVTVSAIGMKQAAVIHPQVVAGFPPGVDEWRGGLIFD
jgi:hypothetical protein